jgi:hypothetical protein
MGLLCVGNLGEIWLEVGTLKFLVHPVPVGSNYETPERTRATFQKIQHICTRRTSFLFLTVNRALLIHHLSRHDRCGYIKRGGWRRITPHTPVTIINLSLSTQVCVGFADLGAVDVLLFSFTVSCEPATCGFCCGCSLGVNAVAVE